MDLKSGPRRFPGGSRVPLEMFGLGALRPLRSRLLVTVLVLAALSAAALVWVVLVDARAQREEAVEAALHRLEQRADDRATAIDGWVASREQQLAVVGTYPTLRFVLGERSGPPFPFSSEQGPLDHLLELLQKVRAVSEARAMVVMAHSGEIVAELPDGAASWPEVAATARRAFTGRRSVAELVAGDGRRWRAVVAMPILAGSGDELLGAVVMVSDPGRWLGAGMDRPEWSSTESTRLIREFEGRTVEFELSAGPSLGAVAWQLGSRIIGRSGASERAWTGVIAEPDGPVLLSAARRIRISDWWVVVLSDQSGELEHARARFHLQATSLGLLLAGLFAVGVVHWRARRQELEQALSKTEARLALVLDHADLGILFTDTTGVLRYASGGAELLFSRPRDELVGRRFRSLCTEDATVTDDSLYGAKPTGAARTFELDGLRPDGTSFPMELVVRQVELDGERLALMLVRDVSLRRRNDLELRRKNEFISTILENLPLALSVNAIDDGELLYANPVFEQAYGWPRDRFETVDDAFAAMFPDPLEREAARSRIVADVLRGGSRPCKWDSVEITTAAGERRFITAVGIPLFGQNLVIAAAQDVTEARRTRIHLAQRERLAAVGELAAGIAHDFNNLLQVIVMNSELAMMASGVSTEASRYLEVVLAQSIRGADLIRQILDFARETALELHPVELGPIVRESLVAVKPTLSEGVDVQYSIDAVGLHAAADPTRIQQLVTNLVINASDAMPTGGLIQVCVQPFDLAPGEEPPIAGMAPGRWIRLAVADEGVGMTADVVSRVFEPFFTTKPRTRGTGLGLALVYGIVAQHHGHIGVTSAPGRGATFSVYLPRIETAPPDSTPDGVDAGRLPRGGGATVLVVEDDEAIRQIATQGLELLGYQVIAVADGAAAFETLESGGGAVDVVLSDLVMPGMDGTRLAREVRARWPGIRIVLMTGYTPDHDSGERLAAGIAACLHKPFTLSELARTVAHVLAQPLSPPPVDE